MSYNNSTGGYGGWGGSGNGDAIWGHITGTLSDQTDLQNALNAKQNLVATPTLNNVMTMDGTGQGVNSGFLINSTNPYTSPSGTQLADALSTYNFVTSLINTSKGLQPAKLLFTTNQTLSGLPTQDGYTCVDGDRVVCSGQTNSAENLVYNVHSDAWTIASDSTTVNDLLGAWIAFNEGTYVNTYIYLVSITPLSGDVAPTSVTWSTPINSALYQAGTGLTLTGSVFSITNTAVTPAIYTVNGQSLFTVNPQGQLTSASNISLALSNLSDVSESGLLAGQTLLYNATTSKWVNALLIGTSNQVVVTPADGSVTLSLPQSIATTSDVVFNSVTALRYNLTENSTVATGQTINLTSQSNSLQTVTGTDDITFVLPDATTLLNGREYEFINNGTGVITIKDYSNSIIISILQNNSNKFTLLNNSMSAGIWDYSKSISGVLAYDKVINIGKLNFKIPSASSGQNWTSQSSGTTDGFNRIIINSAGLMCAVGLNGLIKTSNDNGVTWTTRTSGTAANLNGITVNALDRFIAVGANGTVVRSDDGINWVSATFGTDEFYSVTWKPNYGKYSLGMFVAVGTNGTVRTSTDNGGSWTARTSATVANLYGVTVNNAGRFIAVGADGNIVRSDDGVSWFSSSSGVFPQLHQVSSTPENIFIAVGINGTIIVSYGNGSPATWVSRSSGTTQNLNGITANNNNFICVVGNNGTILTSTNEGNSWSSKTSGTTQNLMGVRINQSGVICVVGATGTVLTSLGGNGFQIESIGSSSISMNASGEYWGGAMPDRYSTNATKINIPLNQYVNPMGWNNITNQNNCYSALLFDTTNSISYTINGIITSTDNTINITMNN